MAECIICGHRNYWHDGDDGDGPCMRWDCPCTNGEYPPKEERSADVQRIRDIRSEMGTGSSAEDAAPAMLAPSA